MKKALVKQFYLLLENVFGEDKVTVSEGGIVLNTAGFSNENLIAAYIMFDWYVELNKDLEHKSEYQENEEIDSDAIDRAFSTNPKWVEQLIRQQRKYNGHLVVGLNGNYKE